MNLICKSCNHDFVVDENNIDTEKIDCPQCSWPNQIMRKRLAHGISGRFTKTGLNQRINISGRTWPSSGLN